jgi:hypothetical protein
MRRTARALAGFALPLLLGCGGNAPGAEQFPDPGELHHDRHADRGDRI